MLRIKDEKWEEFCNNAESLGFGKIPYSYCIDGEKIDYTCRADCYIDITNDKKLWICADSYGEDLIFNKVFDLIALGYVEKVE